MADVTGVLRADHDGKTYDLRLTMGGIAELQGRFGNDLDGLLSGGEAIPNFGVLLAVVEVALVRGGGVSSAKASALADDLLTADSSLAGRLIKAAFPDASPGSAPGKTGAPVQD